jgi:O-antigen ligase
VGKILLPLMIVLLILCPDLRDRVSRLTRAPQAWAFFALIGAMCVSVPFSLLGRGSLKELIEFLQTSTIVALAIGLAVRNKDDLVTVVTGVAVSVALLGGATVRNALLAGGGGRYSASFTYDPNDVAFACVVGLPLAFWLLAAGGRWFHRLAGLAGIGGALLGVMYSGSRGGFLGLGAVLLAVLLKRGRALPLKRRIAFLVLVCAGLALAPSDYWTRISALTKPTEGSNWNAETGRKKVWQRGIRYALQRPFWGVGFRQFNVAEGKLSGVDTGGRGWKWSRFERHSSRTRDPTLEAWGKALRVALIGFFVAGFFLSQAYGGVAITMAGLGMATTVLIHRSWAAAAQGKLAISPAGKRRRGQPGRRWTNTRLRRGSSPKPRQLDGHATAPPDQDVTRTR